MLTLWGRISSVNVRKAVWAAQELGLAFKRIDAGRHFGLLDTPEFLALNPHRQIPVLQDGPVTLWESNVIVRYLGARYGGPDFYPADLAQRFEAEKWMDWQQATLNPPSVGAFFQLIRTPVADRNPAVLEKSVAETTPLHALLDAHLASRRFMGGDSFSMADIPVGCSVHRWFNLPMDRPAMPHLERWFAELSARPAVKGVFDIALS